MSASCSCYRGSTCPPTPVVATSTTATTSVAPAPPPTPAPGARPGITSVQTVLFDVTTTNSAMPATALSPSGDGAVIGGIVGGVLVALLLGVVVGWLVARRRKRDKQPRTNQQNVALPSNSSSAYAILPSKQQQYPAPNPHDDAFLTGGSSNFSDASVSATKNKNVYDEVPSSPATYVDLRFQATPTRATPAQTYDSGVLEHMNQPYQSIPISPLTHN